MIPCGITMSTDYEIFLECNMLFARLRFLNAFTELSIVQTMSIIISADNGNTT